MWLYKMTNRQNGKAYIGTSINPISHRISRHLYAANRGCMNMAIARAIRKYSLAAFVVECIGTATDYEELLKMEAKEIQEQNTLLPNGYNITSGGRGARRACSQETRARISAKHIGRHPWNFGKRNPKTIARYSRTGHIGGVKPGTPSPKRGKKYGPLSEAHKKNIAAGVRRIRAIRFWNTNKNLNSSFGGL